jgi:hypothetical protein
VGVFTGIFDLGFIGVGERKERFCLTKWRAGDEQVNVSPTQQELLGLMDS